MIIVLIVAASFCLIANLLIWIALKFNNSFTKTQSKNKISVIVAAKNEEQNISNLVHSVYLNDYDQIDFEVIVVDDESTDSTLKILKELALKFKTLKIISSSNKQFPGKKGALAVGINASAFDYILITDADCVVSKKWIETFAKEFSNGNDFLFGVAPLTNDLHKLNYFFELDNENNKRFLSRGLPRNDSLKDQSNDDGHFDPPQAGEKSHSQLDTKSFNDEQSSNEINFISKLSSFENLRSSILTFASAKLSLPYSAAARSFGFKKSSFEQLEGYSRTTKTLSGDDDLLLREAVKANMKINCIIESQAFVYSETKKSFKEYLTQKSRHTKTSAHYLFKSQLILGLWHIINLLLLAAVFLIPVDSIYLIFFLTKLLVDVIVIFSLQKKFGYSFNLVQIILLQPVYEVMIVVNFFSAMLLPDKWK